MWSMAHYVMEAPQYSLRAPLLTQTQVRRKETLAVNRQGCIWEWRRGGGWKGFLSGGVGTSPETDSYSELSMEIVKTYVNRDCKL